MSDRPTPETDAAAEEVGMGHFMVDADFSRRLEQERDEARSMTERQWLLRVGSRLCMAGCKSDGILDSIDEIIRERDETRGAIKSTIAWLKERRNAPDFTTMGMVEERLLKALEAAK